MTPERRDDLAETIHRDEWHGALDTAHSFTATVTLVVSTFPAHDLAHANEMIDAYVTRLARVTDEVLAWPEVTWQVEGVGS